MKQFLSIVWAGSVLSAVPASAEIPGFQEKSPFAAVTSVDGAIVVRFPEKPVLWHRLVDGKAETTQQSKPGQFLRLVSGAKLNLIPDRHFHYQVEARLKPQPGVELVYRFDGRSFGRGVMEHTFFVPATPLGETVEKQAGDGQVFPEELVTAWGYRTLKSTTVEQTGWETAHFGKATVRRQSIKAVEQARKDERIFYQFNITEETFATEEEAESRIRKIRDAPPDVNTKADPEWVLRDGVASGKKAYIVSTGSLMFQIEALPGLMERLRKRLGEK